MVRGEADPRLLQENVKKGTERGASTRVPAVPDGVIGQQQREVAGRRKKREPTRLALSAARDGELGHVCTVPTSRALHRAAPGDVALTKTARQLGRGLV